MIAFTLIEPGYPSRVSGVQRDTPHRSNGPDAR
jgi:hypothetical protein